MELSSLLQSLAQSLGLETLALNENGVLSLQFNDTIVVHLEPDPERESCHLYSPLCRVPEDAAARLALYEAVLSGNNFGRGTEGATFSFDEGSKEILLGRQFHPEATDATQLQAWLTSLISIMDTWQKRLPDIVGETELPEAEPLGEHMNFIRA